MYALFWVIAGFICFGTLLAHIHFCCNENVTVGHMCFVVMLSTIPVVNIAATIIFGCLIIHDIIDGEFFEKIEDFFDIVVIKRRS